MDSFTAYGTCDPFWERQQSKDAQPYQEKDVLEALQELKKIIQDNDR